MLARSEAAQPAGAHGPGGLQGDLVCVAGHAGDGAGGAGHSAAGGQGLTHGAAGRSTQSCPHDVLCGVVEITRCPSLHGRTREERGATRLSDWRTRFKA
eukprot:858017-Pelagomonas_calceolata.AAC.3